MVETFNNKTEIGERRFNDLNSLFMYFSQFSNGSFLEKQDELDLIVPWEVTYPSPEDTIQAMTVRYSEKFLRLNDLDSSDFPLPLFVFHLNSRYAEDKFFNPVKSVDINIFNSLKPDTASELYTIDLEDSRALIARKPNLLFNNEEDIFTYIDLLVPKSELNWDGLVKFITTVKEKVPSDLYEVISGLERKTVSEVSSSDIKYLKLAIKKNEFRLKKDDLGRLTRLVDVVDIVRQSDYLKALNFLKSSTPWLVRRKNLSLMANLALTTLTMIGIGISSSEMDEIIDAVDPRTPEEMLYTFTNQTFFDGTYDEAITVSEDLGKEKYNYFLTKLKEVMKKWGANEIKVDNIAFPNIRKIFSHILFNLDNNIDGTTISNSRVPVDIIDNIDFEVEPDEHWDGDIQANKGFLKNLLKVLGFYTRSMLNVPRVSTEDQLEEGELHHFSSFVELKLPNAFGDGLWLQNPVLFLDVIVHELNHSLHFDELSNILKEINLDDYAELIGLQYEKANNILEKWLEGGPDSFELFTSWALNTKDITEYEYVEMKQELGYPNFRYYTSNINKDINEFIYWCVSRYFELNEVIKNNGELAPEEKIFLKKYHKFGIGNWAIDHVMHHLISIIPADIFIYRPEVEDTVESRIEAAKTTLFNQYCEKFLHLKPGIVIKRLKESVLGFAIGCNSVYSSKGNLWINRHLFVSYEGFELFERAKDQTWYLNSNKVMSSNPNNGEVVIYPNQFNTTQKKYSYYLLDRENIENQGQVIEIDKGFKSIKSFNPILKNLDAITENGDVFGYKTILTLEYGGEKVDFPLNLNTSDLDLNEELKRVKVITKDGLPIGVVFKRVLLPSIDILSKYGNKLVSKEGVSISFINSLTNEFGIAFQSSLYVFDTKYEDLVKEAIANNFYIGLSYLREGDRLKMYLIVQKNLDVHRLPVIRGEI